MAAARARAGGLVSRALPVLLLTGCASYYTASGRAAAEGALDDLTGPDAGARYAAVAAETTRAAGAAARSELLGLETQVAATALIKTVGDTAKSEVAGVVRAAGGGARAELLKERTDLLKTVRLALDEALSKETLREVAALREELAGAPLQDDLDAIVDSAAPHLAVAVTTALGKVVLPVQAAADAEAAEWRPVAIAFAVGCGLLVVCLGFAGWLIRGHQQTIRALAAGERRP